MYDEVVISDNGCKNPVSRALTRIKLSITFWLDYSRPVRKLKLKMHKTDDFRGIYISEDAKGVFSLV